VSDRLINTFECEAILFDLDGVLVDSTRCIERTWTAWAHRLGLDPSAVTKVAHGRRAVETVRLMAPQLNAEREAARLAVHEASAVEGVFEISGARELLHGLPPSRWGIVTSAVRDVAKHRLALVRLPIPRVIICADDVANGKPHAEGFLAAAKMLGYAPASCVVIEDAPAGLAAARSAGMRAVAISATLSEHEMCDAMMVVPELAALAVEVHRRVDGTRLQVGVRTLQS
jgi:sugar-phosphatase